METFQKKLARNYVISKSRPTTVFSTIGLTPYLGGELIALRGRPEEGMKPTCSYYVMSIFRKEIVFTIKKRNLLICL